MTPKETAPLMPTKHLTRLGALTGMAAAGLLLALTVNTKPANAYSISDLPNMGFGVTFISLPENGCHGYRVGWHNDNKTSLGSDCDPGFQDNLDAFMASHCPPYVCPELATTATVTTAVTTTQTTTETVTLPPLPAVTTMETVAVVHEVPSPFVDNDPPPYIAPSPPTASFTDSESGLTLTATDTSGNQSVTWSFGDGANGAGPTATHTFSAAGDYTIIETVIDGNGLSAQAARTVTVANTTSRRSVKLMPLG